MSQFSQLQSSRNSSRSPNKTNKKARNRSVMCPHFKINRETLSKISIQVSGILSVKLEEPYCKHVGLKPSPNIYICSTCSYLGCEDEHITEHYESNAKSQVRGRISSTAEHAIFFRVSDKNNLLFYCCLCKGIIFKDALSSDEANRMKKICNTIFHLSNRIIAKAIAFNSSVKKKQMAVLNNTNPNKTIVEPKISEIGHEDESIIRKVFPDLNPRSTLRDYLRCLSQIIISNSSKDQLINEKLRFIVMILNTEKSVNSIKLLKIKKNIKEAFDLLLTSTDNSKFDNSGLKCSLLSLILLKMMHRSLENIHDNSSTDDISEIKQKKNLSNSDDKNRNIEILSNKVNSNVDSAIINQINDISIESQINASDGYRQNHSIAANTINDESVQSSNSQMSVQYPNNNIQPITENNHSTVELHYGFPKMKINNDSARSEVKRTGIQNFGNTCHTCSLLQLLMTCPMILLKIKYLSEVKYIPIFSNHSQKDKYKIGAIHIDQSGNKLAKIFIKTVTDYTKHAEENSVLDPSALLNMIMEDIHPEIYFQQDVLELIDILFSRIESEFRDSVFQGILELENSNTLDKKIIQQSRIDFEHYNPLKNLLYASVNSHGECKNCEFIFNDAGVSNYYIYSFIEVTDMSIQEAVNRQQETSLLECPKCHANKFSKSTNFKRSPRYLMVGIHKNFDTMKQRLDFNSVTLKLINGKMQSYHILFIVLYVYINDVRHYFAISVDPIENKFKVLNDSHVEDVDFEYVSEQAKANGCMFVYEKK